MTATTLPLGETQFFDAVGNQLSNGSVYFYSPGTTIPATTWQDAAQTIPNTNPVLLDAAGRALIYGVSTYRQVVYDVNNNLIWDQLVTAFGPASTAAQTIANIAALRAATTLSLTATNVNLVGYYTATITGTPDGGGGTFTYDSTDTSSTDNGGTIIVDASGRRWKRPVKQEVTVIQFGAKADGVTDDSAAIQAALDFAVGVYVVRMLPSVYVVKTALNVYKGTQLVGSNIQAGNDDYAAGAVGVKILFQPTVANSDLFTLQNNGGVQPFRSMCGIRGIWAVGDGGVNARSCISLNTGIYNEFVNLRIRAFQKGISCSGTVDNVFRDVYISNCTVKCVEYPTQSTTDLWDHCRFRIAPIGVTIVAGVSQRFSNCLFEQLDTNGVIIDDSSRSVQFANCYCEDVPFTNTATGSMFQVGAVHNGSSLSTVLQVVGGNYAGRNAGIVGTFCDVDTAVGVQLIGPYVKTYTNLIQTTANTSVRAVQCAGIQYNSVTNAFNDSTKIDGFLNTLAVNGAFGSQAYMRIGNFSSLIVSFSVNETKKTVNSANGLTTLDTSGVGAGHFYLTGTAGASFAITLPPAASAIDGQKIVVMSTAARASTTWTSTGATVFGAPSSLTAGVAVCLHYDTASLGWYVSS